MSASTESGPRIAVVGGGFGGLYTAVKLDSLLWKKGTKPQITLVDQGDRFVFKPLLYELLNGTADEGEVAPTFNELLSATNIRFVQAKVVGVDTDVSSSSNGSSTGADVAPPYVGMIKLEGGESVPYDWLVLALGAESDSRGVPGVSELAVPFITYEDAVKVREALREVDARSDGRVVVVGGGYAGVELTAVVAERVAGKGSVTLITPGASILEGAPAGQAAAARKALDQLGVTVMTGTKVVRLRKPEHESSSNGSSASGTTSADLSTACYVDVAPFHNTTAAAPTDAPASSSSASVDDASVSAPSPSPSFSSSVDGPAVLPADIVLWTAGQRPATPRSILPFTLPGTRASFPFPTTPTGQVQTESTLRVIGHPRVFALGDVSRPGADGSSSGASAGLPATAQVAFQEADYAAWNIWSAINNRPLLPFRYQHLGNMMTLGTLSGAVALPATLPSSLASAIQSSPLGPLLGAVGVTVGKGDGSDSSDGSDAGVTLEGPLAAVVRRAAYLIRQPTNEQRLDVATGWVKNAAETFLTLAKRPSTTSR